MWHCIRPCLGTWRKPVRKNVLPRDPADRGTAGTALIYLYQKRSASNLINQFALSRLQLNRYLEKSLVKSKPSAASNDTSELDL